MHEKYPLLLETIKIEDGKIHNLPYHQQRCNYSRKMLYNTQNILDLSLYIVAPKKGLYRCRILYNTTLHSIEYIPYKAKEIHMLKIVSSDITYTHKYANRKPFDTLLKRYANFDEIIIEKNGFLSDTTISNIAFYDKQKWVTPSSCLLKGTMRQQLIDKGFLHTKEIKSKDLLQYTKVALINAMLGFKELNHIQIQDTKGNTYDY